VTENQTVNCPNCNSGLDVATIPNGQRFACPACGHILRAESTPDGSGFTFIEYIKSICTRCGYRLHVRGGYVGQRVLCTICGEPFVAMPEENSFPIFRPAAAATVESDSNINLEETPPPVVRDKDETPWHPYLALVEQASPQQLAEHLRQLHIQLKAKVQTVEQLETSLQIERKANAATLEELLYMRRDWESARQQLTDLKQKLEANAELGEQSAHLAAELEAIRGQRDILEVEKCAAVEQLEQLRELIQKGRNGSSGKKTGPLMASAAAIN
jgi:predicted RNA-binding Zn-ribbon protein involved in translation (DUF1610 family)